MAGDPQAKARKALRCAQADFEKAQDKLEAIGAFIRALVFDQPAQIGPGAADEDE